MRYHLWKFLSMPLILMHIKFLDCNHYLIIMLNYLYRNYVRNRPAFFRLIGRERWLKKPRMLRAMSSKASGGASNVLYSSPDPVYGRSDIRSYLKKRKVEKLDYGKSYSINNDVIVRKDGSYYEALGPKKKKKRKIRRAVVGAVENSVGAAAHAYNKVYQHYKKAKKYLRGPGR